jgi:hypothetical protein
MALRIFNRRRSLRILGNRLVPLFTQFASHIPRIQP